MTASHSLLVSKDGSTWRSVTEPFDRPGITGEGVRWANFVDPGGTPRQMFIANVFDTGPTLHQCIISPDGLLWSASTVGTVVGAIQDGSTVPTGSFGLIAVTSSGTLPATLAGSNDGVNWTSLSGIGSTQTPQGTQDILFANGAWLLGEQTGGSSADIYRSTNLGGAFTQEVNPLSSAPAGNIGVSFASHNGATVIALGFGTTTAAYNELGRSTNSGVSWTGQIPIAGGVLQTRSPRCGAYSPSLTTWLIGGRVMTDSSGTNPFTLLTSTDNGVTWVGSNPAWPGGGSPLAMCWSTTHSLFMVVGGTTWFATSANGSTWTFGTLPFSATSANDVDISPTLGMFVAACSYSIPGGWIVGSQLSSASLPGNAWISGNG